MPCFGRTTAVEALWRGPCPLNFKGNPYVEREFPVHFKQINKNVGMWLWTVRTSPSDGRTR
jgi:hypothetical protein